MRVKDLKEIDLDYWVARAEGYEDAIRWYFNRREWREGGEFSCIRVNVTEFKCQDGWKVGDRLKIDWDFLGGILERDKLTLIYNTYNPYSPHEPYNDYWICTEHWDEHSDHGNGYKTALEATKRCIVLRKYGEYVSSKENNK